MPTRTGRSSDTGTPSGLPWRGGFGRHGLADSGGQLGQRLGNRPRASQRAEPRAAAGKNGPGIAGEDLEAQATCKRDQGLDGSLVQSGQMKCGGVDSGGGVRRQPLFPPVRAQRIAHRPRGVKRQRRNIHAPAGSAGGAPRIGARAGEAPGLAAVLAGAAAGSAGGKLRGGSGWFFTSRSRSSRSMVSRSSSA